MQKSLHTTLKMKHILSTNTKDQNQYKLAQPSHQKSNISNIFYYPSNTLQKNYLQPFPSTHILNTLLTHIIKTPKTKLLPIKPTPPRHTYLENLTTQALLTLIKYINKPRIKCIINIPNTSKSYNQTPITFQTQWHYSLDKTHPPGTSKNKQKSHCTSHKKNTYILKYHTKPNLLSQNPPQAHHNSLPYTSN